MTRTRITPRMQSYSRRPMIPQGPSGERKAIDVDSSYECSTTGSIAIINPCARGDALNERIGRKTFLRSLYLRGLISPTLTTGISQTGRVLVVYDSQPNGALPAITDVLNAVHTLSHLNLSNSLRFRVVYDQSFGLTDATGTSNKYETFEAFRKLNLPVHYNSGDAGTIADITTGSLLIITVGSVASGATDAVATIRTRVRYTDA